MRKILFFFTMMFLVSLSPIHAEGGGGNYSKDKACKLTNGMYGYNLQITNYPGYNTVVRNFVKEGNILYYIVNATPIEGRVQQSEYFLWSWDCKNKKPKQLSGKNFFHAEDPDSNVPDSAEIDYMNKNFIIVRTKMNILLCEYQKVRNANSDEKSSNRYIECMGTPQSKKEFEHTLLDRSVYTPSNFTHYLQTKLQQIGYLDTWFQKHAHFTCTLSNTNSYVKSSSTPITTSPQNIFVPEGYSSCSYYNYSPHILDIRSERGYPVIDIGYGPWMDFPYVRMTIKMDKTFTSIMQ